MFSRNLRETLRLVTTHRGRNNLCKLINKIFNKRLSPALAHLVGPTQFGFIKGRDTTHAVRASDKLLKTHYTLVALDFARAYTNTNTSLLFSLLSSLGLDSTGRAWFTHLFKPRQGHILVNGRIIGKCRMARGLRQGDPLSPALFNIFVSAIPFIIARIDSEIVVIQFADDTILAFPKGASVTHERIAHILNTLAHVLHIPINHTKTQITSLLNLDASFRHVGYILPITPSSIDTKFKEIAEHFKRLAGWSKTLRFPTHIRAQVFNKLALGKLTHPARVGIPSGEIMRELEWAQRIFLGKTFKNKQTKKYTYFGRKISEYAHTQEEGGISLIYAPTHIKAIFEKVTL